MSIILSIYPYSKGYGYALFNDAVMIDGGNITISPVSNTKTLRKITQYCSVARPDVIVVRSDTQRISPRLAALFADIKRMAQDTDTPVIEITRSDIQTAFRSYECGVSKHEIAAKICQWFPHLSHHLQPKRQTWDTQHPRMSIFDAVSMIFAYFHYLHDAYDA